MVRLRGPISQRGSRTTKRVADLRKTAEGSIKRKKKKKTEGGLGIIGEFFV